MARSSSKFKGTGVALITPFRKGKIDYKAFRKIINFVIQERVSYLVPLGSTGECGMLSDREQRAVLDFVIKVNKGRKPIVAGNFGGKNTAEIVRKIKRYNFKGIDAILSASPEYVKPTQEGIYQHYMAMEKVSPVPIILYNVPGRTKSNMEWTTTIKLAKASKKFVAIKEASGDLVQVTKIVQNRPKGFLVLSGDDEVALPILSVGGDGIISVIANVLPKEFSRMMRLGLKGDFTAARKWNDLTYDLHKWLYLEGNPVGVKSAMAVRGLCTNEVRLPLYKMSDDNYAQMKDCLLRIINP